MHYIAIALFFFILGASYLTVVTFLLKQYKTFVYRRRFKKAVDKWNGDLAFLMDKMKSDPDGIFYWNQLVWQEIEMWCKLGKKVGTDEFVSLCNHREFNLEQRRYLYNMLAYVGLDNVKVDYNE